jgi:predicted PurR-regulated permease PerM
MEGSERRDTGARVLLIIASLVIVVAGLKAASTVILPFLIAMFLAILTLPLLNWLQSRKVPKALAVLITLLFALGVLAGLVFLVGESIQGFTAAAPKYRTRLEGLFTNLIQWLQSRGIEVSTELLSEFVHPARALDLATGTLQGVARVLSNMLLVFLIIVFFLVEAAGFPAKLQAAFGERGSSERFAKIQLEIQRYLATKTVISLATGLIVGISMAIIGVDFAILWGSLAFMLNYIPNLGSIIAAVPPVLLAVVQLGPGYAIAVAIVFLATNLTFGNLVEPYLMGRRLGLSTLVVFLSLVFWGWVWGPVGMLLSVPLTMIVKILLENTEDLRWIAVLLGAGAPEESLPVEVEKPGSA